MKATRIIMMTLVALLFNTVMGATLSAAFGLPLVATVLGIQAAALIPMPQGLAFAGVKQEIWTGELVKAFRSDPSFLSTIRSYDQYVNNDVIHLVDVGADPTVLINNTTYPIAVVARTDGDIPIALDKFDTTNTSVSDDELYALPYDKIASVVEQHAEVLKEVTAAKAAHALAPNTAANGPIVLTTGASNGATNQRKRMTVADVITMKEHFDALKVPKQGRVAVLSTDHVNDLLRTDEKFKEQYMNIREGVVLKLHGFSIYEFVDTPIYSVVGESPAVLTKKAYAAAANAATDQVASVFYYAPRAFKASGSTTMYMREAAIDPENRRTVAGFRQYFICLPKKMVGFGAVVSAIHT